MLRPPGLYTRAIMETCRVDGSEAQLIEQVMRNTYPTLDGLTRREFDEAAIAAQNVLKDPKIRVLYTNP